MVNIEFVIPNVRLQLNGLLHVIQMSQAIDALSNYLGLADNKHVF